MDWQNNNTNFANETKVPASCCSAAHGISEDLSQQCQKTPEDDRFSTKLPGCYGEFQSFVQDHSRVILAVAGTTIGVMVRESQTGNNDMTRRTRIAPLSWISGTQFFAQLLHGLQH